MMDAFWNASQNKIFLDKSKEYRSHCLSICTRVIASLDSYSIHLFCNNYNMTVQHNKRKVLNTLRDAQFL